MVKLLIEGRVQIAAHTRNNYKMLIEKGLKVKRLI